ncbi:MAG: hypothetical protein F6K19_43295, partial [Cyanothece sp. SIO1E1]|nr:hypothetical protein [Cyanothece sp. SIO1E1]
MSDPQPPEAINEANQTGLEELAWAIEMSVGQFTLFLARCNYAGLRSQLAARLRAICSVEIRTITLKASARTLFTTLRNELGDEQPQALMVFGLESVRDLDEVLAATDQVREEFRKSFTCPMVLWVDDPTFIKLTRQAPNFTNWAGGTTRFAIAPDTLTQALQQAADQLFSILLAPNSQRSFDQLLVDLDLGFLQRSEVDLALQDLRTQGQTLEPALQADLDFSQGLNALDQAEALECFQRSLKF